MVKERLKSSQRVVNVWIYTDFGRDPMKYLDEAHESLSQCAEFWLSVLFNSPDGLSVKGANGGHFPVFIRS